MTLMRLQRDDPPRVGRYLLTARLGAGGMGIVYLGQADDGRQVAVKVLRPEYADDPETRRRFKREATAIARVRSPHAVQVLDADPDRGMPYLATEFADGPSLEDHVKTYGPLHPEALVRLASALAEALVAIHSADVTHRDLKPSNVLLTNSGPKVIDFGIARVANDVPITKTGTTLGSPGYMAPEQVSGHGGRESDIFAWALVLAFAASGRPPFGTGPALTVMHRILDGPPDVSAVPPGLIPLVTKAIAEDPADRPTAAELLRELSSGSADLAGPAAIAAVAAGERAEAEPGTATLVSSGPRRGWRAAAVSVPVVALMAAAGVLLGEGGVHPGVHPPDHANHRPSAVRTAPSRVRGVDPSADPGSVAGSGVPGSASGGGSPAGSPHPGSSPVTSQPVSSPSPDAPSSSAPPSSAAPSTAPPSSAPASTAPASTAPASTAPASTAPASTAPPSTAAPSSAPPSGESPSASSSGSASSGSGSAPTPASSS